MGAVPYPVEALGPILGGAVVALRETVQAPVELCAQCVLGAAALAAQAHFDVRMCWGSIRPLSLNQITVGQSGERKTELDGVVLAAAKAAERRAMEEFRAAMAEFEADDSAWRAAAETAKRNAGKKGALADDIAAAVEAVGPRPKAPVRPMKFVGDPTVEGLYMLLASGQPSVGLFSDEAGLLVGGHAMNRDNGLKTMARLSKFWDGAPFDRVRAGDGGGGVLYGRRLTSHLMMQPVVAEKLLNDPYADGQGYLARALLAWPQSTIGTRVVDAFRKPGDHPDLRRLFAVLASLMEAPPPVNPEDEKELAPRVIDLDSSAVGLALAYSNAIEGAMGKGGDFEMLRDRAAKSLENAIRIAAILAVVEGGLDVGDVTGSQMARGIELASWYLMEWERVRQAATVPPVVQDAERLLGWIALKGMQVVVLREILNAGPGPLRRKDRAVAALGELTRAGYLRPVEGAVVDGVRHRKAWEVDHVEV
jgi:putative DNA primase/helicase